MACGGRHHEKVATDDLLRPARNCFAMLSFFLINPKTCADAPTPYMLSDLSDRFLQSSGQTADIRYKRLRLPDGPRLTFPEG